MHAPPSHHVGPAPTSCLHVSCNLRRRCAPDSRAAPRKEAALRAGGQHAAACHRGEASASRSRDTLVASFHQWGVATGRQSRMEAGVSTAAGAAAPQGAAQQRERSRGASKAQHNGNTHNGSKAALRLRPADAAFDEEVARLLNSALSSDSGGAESGRSSAPGESRDTGSSNASWIWAPESLTDTSAAEHAEAQPAAQPAAVAEMARQLTGAGSTQEVLAVVVACNAKLDEALVCLALQQLCRAAAGESGAAAGRTDRSLLLLVARVLELRTAFVPHQLAHVLRCLAALKMQNSDVYARLEEAVMSWAPEDFSPGPRADVLWAFASAGYQPAAAVLAGFAEVPPARARRAVRLPVALAEVAPQPQRERGGPGGARRSAIPPPARLQREASGEKDVELGRSLVVGLGQEQLGRLLWAYARLGHRPELIVEAAAESFTADACCELPTQVLVQTLWACAKMRASGAALLTPAVAEVAARLPPPGSPADSGGDTVEQWQLSTVLWVCGRLEHHPGWPQLQSFTVAAEAGIPHMSLRDLARVCWALARLGHHSRSLMHAASAQMQAIGPSDEFNVDNVPMILWAFATLDHNPGKELLDLLAAKALAQRKHLVPATLSSVLWSFSSLGYVNEEVFEGLDAAAMACMSDFQPPHLVDLCRAHAKAGSAPQLLCDAIAIQAAATIDAFHIHDIIRMVYALSALEQQPAALLEAIEGWTDRRLGALGPHGLSMALWSFARLGASPSSSLLEVAAESVLRQLPSFTPDQVSRATWSFVKLEYYPEALLDAVTRSLTQQSAAYDGKALSNVLWALARHGPVSGTPVMLKAVAAELGYRAKGFSAHSISNIVWSYAKLESQPQPRFLGAMAAAALQQLKTFEAQGIANLLWAFAVMGYSDGQLLPALERAVIPRLEQFEPQHLANLVWSFAKLDYHPKPGLLVAVARTAEPLLPQFSTQECFNLVYGYAKLRFEPRALLAALVPEVVSRAFDFTPQELSNTAWAYARLQHDPYRTRPLLKALASQVLRRVDTFDCQHIATTAWVFAQYDWAPQDALQALANEAERRGADMRPQHISMLLQAAGHLSFHPGRQVGTLLDTARGKLQTFRDFELAGLLQAIGELGLGVDSLGGAPGRILAAIEQQPALLERLVGVTAKSAFVGAFSAVVMLEAYDSRLYARLCERISELPPDWQAAPAVTQQLADATELARLEVTNLPEMHNALRIRLLAYRTQAEPQASLTGSQAEVAEALVGMGVDVRLLVAAAGDAQLVMPILVAMPRGLVAVEVLHGRGTVTFGQLQPTGQTQLRRRRIVAEGYDVIFVLSSEWRILFRKKEPSLHCAAMLTRLLKDYA